MKRNLNFKENANEYAKLSREAHQFQTLHNVSYNEIQKIPEDRRQSKGVNSMSMSSGSVAKKEECG